MNNSFISVPQGRDRPAPVKIGSIVLQPEKFLAEGGYARVYLATNVHNGESVAVKHIITSSERSSYEPLKRELLLVNIVEFYDAETHQLPSGGSEAFICMEMCPGSVINLMNARLQTRFKESEIVTMYSQICEAVAFMHYQSPPIVHRDLKVENILISRNGLFKLCDFGSCTTNILPAGVILRGSEMQDLIEEIEKETTLQYRAPEMCDLYKRRGLNEKTDIWALGVLLYKLCFFITPFENEGKLAILNCKYQFPVSYPYTPFLVTMIKHLLQEHPQRRPNIYQVVKKMCDQQSIPCPIENIYTAEAPPPLPPKDNVPGLQPVMAAAVVEAPVDPNVRRGRAGRSNHPSATQKEIQAMMNVPQPTLADATTYFGNSVSDPFALSPPQPIANISAEQLDPFGMPLNSSFNQSTNTPQENLAGATFESFGATDFFGNPSAGTGAVDLFSSAPPEPQMNSPAQPDIQSIDCFANVQPQQQQVQDAGVQLSVFDNSAAIYKQSVHSVINQEQPSRRSSQPGNFTAGPVLLNLTGPKNSFENAVLVNFGSSDDIQPQVRRVSPPTNDVFTMIDGVAVDLAAIPANLFGSLEDIQAPPMISPTVSSPKLLPSAPVTYPKPNSQPQLIQGLRSLPDYPMNAASTFAKQRGTSFGQPHQSSMFAVMSATRPSSQPSISVTYRNTSTQSSPQGWTVGRQAPIVPPKNANAFQDLVPEIGSPNKGNTSAPLNSLPRK